MNNGRLDRALMLAIFVALGGLYWQMFSMNERQSADIAELNERLSGEIAEIRERLSGEIAELSERLARVETHLEYIVPRLADPATEQSPGG